MSLSLGKIKLNIGNSSPSVNKESLLLEDIKQ